MNKSRLAILGCGNLGQSILQGVLDSNSLSPALIHVTKRNTASLDRFRDHGVLIGSDNREAVRSSELILVALKPYNIMSILEEIKDSFDPGRHILVSLATGVEIAELQKILPEGLTIFRAMPNTASDVKESLTCICSNSSDKAHVELVKDLFDKIGNTIIVNEGLMEAATVLGACGIAYVMRFMRAMVQGGIEIGFDAKTASTIVNQTVKGAAELLIQRNEHPEFEIDKVTTPKGCTIVGLNEMEHNGFSSALIKGLVSSYDRIT